MSIKFLLFRGGGIWGSGGGEVRSADFIFMGAQIFLIIAYDQQCCALGFDGAKQPKKTSQAEAAHTNKKQQSTARRGEGCSYILSGPFGSRDQGTCLGNFRADQGTFVGNFRRRKQ